jgi:protein-L-isoaspartate(D-aspartate) O-methyltransferase
VPRARFVTAGAAADADRDVPLPIGGGHHHAEPSFLAVMLHLARVGPGRRAVILGAGSGYLAALADAAGAEVTAIERDPDLAARAAATVPRARVVVADAFGWHPTAPVDAIVLGGAVSSVAPWLDDLAPDGVLVAPVGDERRQELVSLVRDGEGMRRRGHGAVRFARLSS